LDDFVFQRGDRPRTLPLRLGNIDRRARLRPLCSPQIREFARFSSEPTVIWCRSAVNFSFFFFLAGMAECDFSCPFIAGYGS
jgi:hypothetical protein